MFQIAPPFSALVAFSAACWAKHHRAGKLASLEIPQQSPWQNRLPGARVSLGVVVGEAAADSRVLLARAIPGIPSTTRIHRPSVDQLRGVAAAHFDRSRCRHRLPLSDHRPGPPRRPGADLPRNQRGQLVPRLFNQFLDPAGFVDTASGSATVPWWCAGWGGWMSKFEGGVSSFRVKRASRASQSSLNCQAAERSDGCRSRAIAARRSTRSLRAVAGTCAGGPSAASNTGRGTIGPAKAGRRTLPAERMVNRLFGSWPWSGRPGSPPPAPSGCRTGWS